MAAFPAIKVAYSQTKHGLKITFEVDQNDMPAEIAGSALGTTYMIAAVETDKESGEPKTSPGAADGSSVAGTLVNNAVSSGKPPKLPWSQMLRSKRAGIRCSDPKFQLWLSTAYPFAIRHGDAAEAVRSLCSVASRADLNENHEAAARFDKLDAQFMHDTGMMAEAR